MITEDGLYEDLCGLLPALGLITVDARVQQTRFGTVVHVVVWKEGGVGTKECAAVHRLLAPRLEVLEGVRELSIEVSSPGLDRKLRLPREYSIFKGRGIHLVCRDGKEYRGILDASDASTCTVIVQGKPVTVAMDSVAKAKLDYTQEGETSWA